jgi:hypothetical protein
MYDQQAREEKMLQDIEAKQLRLEQEKFQIEFRKKEQLSLY